MLTYVINTSENKTFDSSRLFELAGYSKIRWLQCSLNDIPKCVDYIVERQNNILADDFRIAVVIDFFGFDKIRIPYGRNGFTSDEGVDMSLYMPYLEVYLMDNLIVKLENRELFAKDFDIYYVQNEKSERYDIFKSAYSQIKQILVGNENTKIIPNNEKLLLIADRIISDEAVQHLLKAPTDAFDEDADVNDEDRDLIDEAIKLKAMEKKRELLLQEKTLDDVTLYSSFTLYCTENISLEFPLSDYPYGAVEMDFEQFWDAFRDRISRKANIRRHYYVVPYGGGASRSALHTLSLSLYLIHLYEREEDSSEEGDMDVEKLDSRMLCEVLENGWSKINAAKIVAKKNNMEYYSLVDNCIMKNSVCDEKEESAEVAIMGERANLPKEMTDVDMSGERFYSEVEAFSKRTIGEIKDRNRKEFDKIMSEYLKNRDDTREADVEAEFLEMKNGGFLQTTLQCPSREQYNYLIKQKQMQISEIFEKVLKAEYIEIDYSEERKKADKAFLEYRKAKAWTTRNIVGDVIFLLLAVVTMIVPYSLLQLTSYSSNAIASMILGLVAAGVFAGLFICSIIFQLLPVMRKLKIAKNKLRDCYLDCCAKERYSFSSIRRRYEVELLEIEQTRYEMRQIKHLFDENLEKEKNVLLHRKMLDNMADCLSSMLNNLDVEPVFDANESVEGEFDLRKSPYSRENKVYQIFSINTIEKIFSKKGREQQ